MKRTICLLLGLALVPVAAYAQDEEPAELSEAMAILTKVDEASKALQSAKFDVKVKGTGGQEELMPRIEATYLVTGWAQNRPEKFHVKFKEHRRTRLTSHVTASYDGQTYFLADHRERTASQGTDEKTLGTARRRIWGGLMFEYLAPTPFSDELGSKKLELRGSKEIGGEDCYEIHITYNTPDNNETTWYFSKKDYLPRGRIDHVSRRRLTGTVEKMVTNLVVDPEITEDSFKVTVPDGYGMTTGE